MTRFALILVVLTLTAPSPAADQDPRALAQQHYAAGRTSYHAEDYQKALGHFQSSLQSYDSPNARLYVARCLARLGRHGEAVLQYQLAASSAAELGKLSDRYKATERAAKKELDGEMQRVAWVLLKVTPTPQKLSISIGNRELPRAALGVPIPVLPGDRVLVVRAPSFQAYRKKLSLKIGETEKLSVRLVSADRRSPKALPGSPRRTSSGKASHADGSVGSSVSPLVWVGLGASVVGVAGFATFYSLAESQHADLEERCAGPCGPDQQDAIDRGRSYQLAANVSLGIVAAGGALALASALLSSPKRPGRAQVSLGLGSLQLSGTF